MSELTWDQLGHAWGLLKLPSMPELKKWDGDRKLGLEIDFSTFAYKDKEREKLRIAEMNGEVEKTGNNGPVKKVDRTEAAWTVKKDQRVAKEVRREKKMKKREHERQSKLTDEQKVEEEKLKGMINKVRKKVVEEEEWEGFSD